MDELSECVVEFFELFSAYDGLVDPFCYGFVRFILDDAIGSESTNKLDFYCCIGSFALSLRRDEKIPLRTKYGLFINPCHLWVRANLFQPISVD